MLARSFPAQKTDPARQIKLPSSDKLQLITFFFFLFSQDYFWAMSSIWSRSFDFLQPGAEGSPSSRRAMVPVINAANHDPSVREARERICSLVFYARCVSYHRRAKECAAAVRSFCFTSSSKAATTAVPSRHLIWCFTHPSVPPAKKCSL